jgi:4-hydroxy-tetrahydrodipicolinate synthase
MANVIPDKIRFLYENFRAENADAVQERLDRWRASTRDYAAIPALKAIMATRTGDPAWRTLRPPLVNLSAAATEEMLAKYAAA